MRSWHPLKIAGILYVVADTSFLLGGLGYENAWLAASGICGLLGNASLLLGGSGAQTISAPRLRRIAPYAERLSLGFYILQYLTFGASYAIMYERVIVSGVLGAVVGLLGCLAGMFVKRDCAGLKPYQIAGGLWLLASLIGFAAALDTLNAGIIAGTLALIAGAVCVMLSHRAEFRDAGLKP